MAMAQKMSAKYKKLKGRAGLLDESFKEITPNWRSGSAFSLKYETRCGFACSRCLKTYFQPSGLLSHVKKCEVLPSNLIHQDGDVKIFLISNEAPLEERKVAENIARVARSDIGYDFTTYTTYMKKEAPHLEPHIFLLYVKEKLVGYAIYIKKVVKEYCVYETEKIKKGPNGRQWSLRLIWLRCDYRKKCYGTLLFQKSFETLGIEPEDIYYSAPLKIAGARLIKRFVEPSKLKMIL